MIVWLTRIWLIVVFVFVPRDGHGFDTRGVDVGTLCDGTESCDDRPRDIMFMIDASNSMPRDRFYREVLDFSQRLFCGFTNNNETRLGLVLFGGSVELKLPLKRYSRKEWISRIEDMREDNSTCCSCCTPHAEAFQLAKDEFVRVKALEESSPFALQVAFVVTDGYPFPNRMQAGYAWEQWTQDHVVPTKYRMKIVPEQAFLLKQQAVRLILVALNNKKGWSPNLDYFKGENEKECDKWNGKETCHTADPEYLPLVSEPVNKNVFYPDKVFSNNEWNVALLVEESLNRICDPTWKPPTPKPTKAPTREPTTLKPTLEPTVKPTFKSERCPTRRDLLIALDASNSMQKELFFGPILDTIKEIMANSVNHLIGGQTGLIIFNEEIENVIPLGTRTPEENIKLLEDFVGTKNTFAFKCCSPYAWMFEEAARIFETRGQSGSERLLVVVGDGHPYQNFLYPSAYARLERETMSRAYYLTRQVPASARRIKDNGGLITYVSVPDKNGRDLATSYFSDQVLNTRECEKLSVTCYFHEEVIVSHPYDEHIFVVKNTSESEIDSFKYDLAEHVCHVRSSPTPAPTVPTSPPIKAPTKYPTQPPSQEDDEDEPEIGEDVVENPYKDLPDPEIKGTRTRDIIVLLDISTGITASFLKNTFAPIVAKLSKSVDPTAGGQFGVIFFEGHVHTLRNIPLKTRNYETMLKKILHSAKFQQIGDSTCSVLASALRESRNMFNKLSSDNKEKIVIIMTTKSPHRHRHYKNYYRKLTKAEYLAKASPLEARMARQQNIRVILVGGPQQDGVIHLNQGYYDGNIVDTLTHFCDDENNPSTCYKYQGRIVSEPLEHNALVLNKWDPKEALPKIYKLLDYSETKAPTPAPVVPPAKKGQNDQFIILVDSAQEQETYRHGVSLINLLEQKLRDMLVSYQGIEMRVFTTSCYDGVKKHTRTNDVSRFRIALRPSNMDKLELAEDHYTCILPGLLKVQQATERSEAGMAVVVFLTTNSGVLQDHLSALSFTKDFLGPNRKLLALVASSDKANDQSNTDFMEKLQSITKNKAYLDQQIDEMSDKILKIMEFE